MALSFDGSGGAFFGASLGQVAAWQEQLFAKRSCWLWKTGLVHVICSMGQDSDTGTGQGRDLVDWVFQSLALYPHLFHEKTDIFALSAARSRATILPRFKFSPAWGKWEGTDAHQPFALGRKTNTIIRWCWSNNVFAMQGPFISDGPNCCCWMSLLDQSGRQAALTRCVA